MYLLPEKMQWEEHTQRYFCDVPANDVWARSNYEETSDEPELRDVLQNIWPIIFKTFKVTKIKQRLRNSSRLKKSKEI